MEAAQNTTFCSVKNSVLGFLETSRSTQKVYLMCPCSTAGASCVVRFLWWWSDACQHLNFHPCTHRKRRIMRGLVSHLWVLVPSPRPPWQYIFLIVFIFLKSFSLLSLGDLLNEGGHLQWRPVPRRTSLFRECISYCFVIILIFLTASSLSPRSLLSFINRPTEVLVYVSRASSVNSRWARAIELRPSLHALRP